jgi:hypothetical protein
MRLSCVSLLLGVAVAVPVFARCAEAADDSGILTVQFENDVVADSDGQFTHGTRLAWMSPEGQVPDWAAQIAGWIPRFAEVSTKRIVYSLGQSIFTPDDITIKESIPDDRPYAGWLYAGIGLVSVGEHVLDNLELNVGVVGPASFAEQTQTTFHRWFGFDRPEGWDHQIENELGIQLYFERKWRAWQSFGVGGLGGDVVPHVGVALGNVLTHGAAGLTLRIGDDLPNDYGPPRIRPSLPGSDYFEPHDLLAWYLFVGAEGRAVGRDIFLDGNTFRDSHSVDKKTFVADFQTGIAFFIGRVRIAYTHVLRTREFEGQDDPEQFGAFSISSKF